MPTTQRSLFCPCGKPRVKAHGLCVSCYGMIRRDNMYFGGLRERVLARDKVRCRGCGRSGVGKGSIGVHHRVLGRSSLKSMVAICPACHACIHHRIRPLPQLVPTGLYELWLEQHPPQPMQQIPLPFTNAA
jgi:hypothetical protein